MLRFNFPFGFESFKERFGIQEHGNGTKSRKNKILLAFVKDQFKKKNYEVINFASMAEMKVYVWQNLLSAGAADESLPYMVNLMGDIFHSDLYQTDEWLGICEDHDTRSLRYQNMEQSGRVYKMKAGKMLHHLINATEYGRSLPESVQRWLEEEFSLQWQTYCMGKLPENKLIINDDFKRIYDAESCVGCFHSCMVNQDHWPFYRDAVDAKAAFLVDDSDMVIARAILYPHVYDDDGHEYRYLDRQYATDCNPVLMRALIDELVKAGEIDIYKVPGCGCGDATSIVDTEGNSMSHLTFHIKIDLETDDTLSYADTFKWYNYSEKKAYNTTSHGWDYSLDTTSYSIDDDYDEDDNDNYDDYHQTYVDSDLTTVYVHGQEMYCADDWLEDFRYVDSEDEYHHKDDVFKCPVCGCWELKSDAVHSDLCRMDFCTLDCVEKAEQQYKETNWTYSHYDRIYVESVTDIRVYNAWQEDTGAYVEQNILADTLIREILAGRMFYVGGQYCDRRITQ